jgi:hypothetical protein
MIRIKIQNARELSFALRKFPQEHSDAVAKGLFNAMQFVMDEATARAPYEFGTLSKSAYVTEPNYSKKSSVVEAGFAGEAADYMVLQHEIAGYQHPGTRSRSPDMARAARGEYKFFEKALNNNKKLIRDKIAEAINYLLERGKLPRKNNRRYPKG